MPVNLCQVDSVGLQQALLLIFAFGALAGVFSWQSGRAVAAAIVYLCGWRIRRRRWARFMIERARA